jgi:DNA-binding NarL/FixJ family response regulator
MGVLVKDQEAPKEKKIKVIVADRHPRIRSEIKQWLAAVSDLSVVGLAGNGAEALDLVQKARPDFLLLDMDLEQPPAWEVITQLRSTSGALFILALCSECGSDYVNMLMKLGADACMMREDGPGLLPEAIYQVIGGYRGLISPSRREEPDA